MQVCNVTVTLLPCVLFNLFLVQVALRRQRSYGAIIQFKTSSVTHRKLFSMLEAFKTDNWQVL